MVLKVSVAMATYNGSKYLREQLDSLYNQTHVPDEVIVVDDRSIDDTQIILEEYHKKFGLLYYVNERNLGVNKNFEKAIKLCTGDYVAICDQDDVWMPQKIEKTLSKMLEVENGKPTCISSQSTNVNQYLQPISKKKKILKDSVGLKPNLFYKNISQGCTLMINRLLIDKFKPFPHDEFMYDGYIGLLAACIGNKYNMAESLMFYRHHQTNVVARIKSNNSFFTRVGNLLWKWKTSTLFDYRRFNNLSILLNLHDSQMSEETKSYIFLLLSYNKSDLLGKITFIYNESFFSIKEKIIKICKLVIAYFFSNREVK